METRKTAQGFTTLELIVVITIITILSAVAVPNLLGYIPKWRLKNAATDLYGNLQLARATAIKKRNNCTVAFSENPDQYTISCTGKTVTLSDYESGISFDSLVLQQVVFQPNGLSDLTPDSVQEVHMTNGGQSRKYAVRVLITGAIEIERE